MNMVWAESKHGHQTKNKWPWASLLLGAGLGALLTLCLGRLPGERCLEIGQGEKGDYAASHLEKLGGAVMGDQAAVAGPWWCSRHTAVCRSTGSVYSPCSAGHSLLEA